MLCYVTLRGLGPFFSCALDLDPMPFINELDPYPLKINWMCENEFNPTSRLSIDRQADTTEIINHAALQWSIKCLYDQKCTSKIIPAM